ncbi:GreA/GreB family elongation factor [Agromyces sp. Marseille-P2726]|uniref:GreA/GreB family elongation factor n=1 Tax=Agromyces sp. Marseille-P2726 TaxID=2709132 RepID=UPI00156D5A50|nr:GreA/GreB family elongation factor [Agromyces sp. Marseille-P2726]
MSTSSHDTLWLTQAAYDRLQAELGELTSRTGDVGPQTEARILELKSILRRAEVGDKPDDGLVEPGMIIVVQFGGDASTTTFLLAQRGLTADDADIDIDVYSPTSPLGEAIIGKYAGDGFAYETPTGRLIEGEIISATPFHG